MSAAREPGKDTAAAPKPATNEAFGHEPGYRFVTKRGDDVVQPGVDAARERRDRVLVLDVAAARRAIDLADADDRVD